MQDVTDRFPPDLSALPRADWLKALRSIGEARGFAEPLGKAHAAVYVDEGDTLLVAFETVPGIEALSPRHTPLGFDMLERLGWSCLTVMSHSDTWFRAPEIYAFFDQLLDDDFFEQFERVVFYGAGPCGYAAAAYSVAAPGARVLVLQPQATLDPRVTGWDDRFADERRRDFTSRYGYAPDMLEAAHRAHVLYDPYERLDAMHAALFARHGVRRFPMPFMGDALQSELLALDLLPPMLSAVAEDRLDTARVAAMMRKRRDHLPYLRRLLAHLDSVGRMGLAAALCRNVTRRMDAPRFRRRLMQLEGRIGGDSATG